MATKADFARMLKLVQHFTWGGYRSLTIPNGDMPIVADALQLAVSGRVEMLEAALRMMMDEKIDYMRVNRPGDDPEKQQTVKMARIALGDHIPGQ